MYDPTQVIVILMAFACGLALGGVIYKVIRDLIA